MLTLVFGLLYLVSGRTVSSQDVTGSRFVCNAIPPGAEPGCGYGPTGNRVQSSSPVEDELRNTIIQLRETILQQKETIVSQQGTIKELNSKLARCEAGSRRKEYGKNTMGDLPRDPGETIDQLGKTMQTLKGRLENLEVRRTNSSAGGASALTPLPPELRELLRQRLGALETQLLRKVTELEEEKSQLYNETAAHRQRTETALNSLMERIAELEKSKHEASGAVKNCANLNANFIIIYKFCLTNLAAIRFYLQIKLLQWLHNVAQLPLSVSDGRWHHICITWTTRDGFWEAYQDGERLGTGDNLAPWHPIKPGGVIILGQEQDIVGGRFDATQAFVGELSQFNMWDRVLRPVDIMGLANCSAYMPGNVVPWIDANVEVFGGASKAALEICEDRAFDS
uniref:Neuronal pentraxin 2a n=1 Tax=Xiphophorus couchianus TaxID=32473 RepID=A0A3B5LUM8_9TELE